MRGSSAISDLFSGGQRHLCNMTSDALQCVGQQNLCIKSASLELYRQDNEIVLHIYNSADVFQSLQKQYGRLDVLVSARQPIRLRMKTIIPYVFKLYLAMICEVVGSM